MDKNKAEKCRNCNCSEIPQTFVGMKDSKSKYNLDEDYKNWSCCHESHDGGVPISELSKCPKEKDKIKIKLLDNRILVKMVEYSDEEDGILIVRSEEVDQTLGEVVSIGDKVKEIFVGNKIMLNKYSGTSVTINGELYRVILENDVLLIILQ